MLCPLNSECQVFQQSDPALYPKKEKKKPVPQKHAIAYIYYHEGKVKIEKRPEKGMLAGMIGFPTSEWIDVSEKLPESVNKKLFIKHVFTHFSLRLYCVVIHKKTQNMIDVKDVESIGLPTLFKKLWNIAADKLE